MGNVLVIDDQQERVVLFSAFLRELIPGCIVHNVQDGLNGIKKAEKEQPDIIIITPTIYGMGADELCKKLKSNPKTDIIPIIMLYAKGSNDARKKCFDAGADLFISEPVDKLEFLAQIRALLRLKNCECLLRKEGDRECALQRGDSAPYENYFQIALRNTSLILAHVDLDLRYTWIFNSHYDFNNKEVLGKRDDELIPAEHVAELIAFKQKVLDEGISSRKIISLPLSNGENIYDVMAEPLRDISGKIIGLTTAAIDITERIKIERELMESEERFRKLFEGMKNCVAIYEAENNGENFIFKDFNPAAERIEKITKEEVIGRRVSEVFPGVKEFGIFEVFRRVFLTGKSEYHPISHYKDNRIAGWRDNFVYKLPSGEIVAIYDDITAQKQAEEQIKASLYEKELLLKEIHHRVKNNMQIISSMLNLQSKYVKDEADKELFNDSQNRVHSMALVHEKIYQAKDLARIDFEDYIKDLLKYLFSFYNIDSKRIRIELSIKNIRLGIDKALPCAQIINELISNSLKHAFPQGKEGEVQVFFKVDDNEHYMLIISDNGIGFPKGMDFRNTESLGLQIINALTMQLKGVIDIDFSHGTKFIIQF